MNIITASLYNDESHVRVSRQEEHTMLLFVVIVGVRI